MNYLLKIKDLEVLRNFKSSEFEKAYAYYCQRGQKIISFREVAQLKDEIFELDALISVIKKLNNFKETNRSF